jgi:triosephosphate isomerase
MGGNWKLNPTTLEAANNLAKSVAALTKDVKNVDTVIFPPFPLLQTVVANVQGSNIKVRLFINNRETSNF